MTGVPSFELGTDGPSAIVVGIDGSTTSLRASAYALGLARRQHSRLVAVYVGSISTMAAVELSTACAVLLARSEAFRERAADLRREAEKAAQEQGVSITFVAARGDPLTELHRIAREIRADTIIVGASTRAGHRLVGSLSVRLVRAGKWPIMVVP
jgi:nucleotide-binding universal stress UspA family protein